MIRSSLAFLFIFFSIINTIKLYFISDGLLGRGRERRRWLKERWDFGEGKKGEDKVSQSTTAFSSACWSLPPSASHLTPFFNSFSNGASNLCQGAYVACG